MWIWKHLFDLNVFLPPIFQPKLYDFNFNARFMSEITVNLKKKDLKMLQYIVYKNL